MASSEGTLVRVKVRAGAAKESIVRKSETMFEIAVKEPAAANHANARVRALLASHFGLPLARVRILSGHHAPSKKFRIHRGDGA